MEKQVRSTLILTATAAIALASVSVLSADTTVGTTSRAGYNDSTDWGQLGACNQSVAPTFTATSAGGLTVTGSEASGSAQETIQRNADSSGGCSYDGWFGNFTPGDNLLWTGVAGSGPITLGFSSAVSGAGLQIMRNAFGAFTAEIDAYNGATLLGTFTEAGNSAFTADNSAIFIGINDLTGPDITSIVISTDSSSFAVNELSLLTSTTSTPEPSSVGMALLLGLGVIGAARRWRTTQR
jgi:PEP-CTERM motif